MASYSIDQFAKITGINKLLIRTWENRYDFLTPERTETNIRLYNEEMLNKGIKYGILVDNGYKISKLVSFADHELNHLIQKTLQMSKDDDTKKNIYISKFLESALYFDQRLFNQTYDLCLKNIGIISFYKDVLIKTMNKISILYLNSEITSANEHFFSENIRLKIGHEIEKEQSISNNYDDWVLFLPENEYHDIGLLFTCFILKKYNRKVIYLGQNTTRESLIELSNKNRNFLFFMNTKRTGDFSKKLYNFLDKNLIESNIYVIENEIGKINFSERIKRINNLEDFIALLSSRN